MSGNISCNTCVDIRPGRSILELHNATIATRRSGISMIQVLTPSIPPPNIALRTPFRFSTRQPTPKGELVEARASSSIEPSLRIFF